MHGPLRRGPGGQWRLRKGSLAHLCGWSDLDRFEEHLKNGRIVSTSKYNGDKQDHTGGACRPFRSHVRLPEIAAHPDPGETTSHSTKLPRNGSESLVISRIAGEGATEALANLVPGPLAIAVIAHPLPTMGGTMDDKVVRTLARFVELGFVTLRFNFRGVGASAGRIDSGNGEVEDMLGGAARARRVGPLPLILAALPGGYIAARAAQRLHPQPHKLVLVAPTVGVSPCRMCRTTRWRYTANAIR